MYASPAHIYYTTVHFICAQMGECSGAKKRLPPVFVDGAHARHSVNLFIHVEAKAFRHSKWVRITVTHRIY